MRSRFLYRAAPSYTHPPKSGLKARMEARHGRPDIIQYLNYVHRYNPHIKSTSKCIE